MPSPRPEHDALVKRPRSSDWFRLRSRTMGYVLSSDSFSISHIIAYRFFSSGKGAYAILFGVSLILLLRRGKGRVLNVPIATGSCILFLSCTAHFAIEFNHFHTTLVSLISESSLHHALMLLPGVDRCGWVCERDQTPGWRGHFDIPLRPFRRFHSHLSLLDIVGEELLGDHPADIMRAWWLW